MAVGDLNNNGEPDVALVGEWIWVGWRVKVVWDIVSTPPLPEKRKQLGNVTIHADGFTDLGSGEFETVGSVRIGDYVVFDDVLVLDTHDNTATGDGLLSLVKGATGIPVIDDSFSLDGSDGVLTPDFGTGYAFEISELGGFSVEGPGSDLELTLDVIEGLARGRVGIDLSIPESDDEAYDADVSFTLYHGGRLTGSVSDLQIGLAGCSVSLKGATLSSSGISIDRAELTLPGSLGAGTVEDLVITPEGLDWGDGTIAVSLPEISVSDQFTLAKAKASLTKSGDKLIIEGETGFSLPNLDTDTDDGNVGISAAFKLDQDGLYYCCLGGSADPGVPLGQSGFQLTALEGCVNFAPLSVVVTGTIESLMEVPHVGAAVQGEPSLAIGLEEPYSIGLSGALDVLGFEAADAALTLSQDDGLKGSLGVNAYLGAVEGTANVHLWKGGSGTYHFTGSAVVDVGLSKGELGKVGCVQVPPKDMSFGSVSAEFGQFCADVDCSGYEYGIKGSVEVDADLWLRTVTIDRGFFFAADGSLGFGGDLDQYTLVEQTTATGLGTLASTATNVHTVTVPTTNLAIFTLDWQQGSPSLALVDPNGAAVNRHPKL